MVYFDPDSNCIEALNVSGYVDVFLDGAFYSRCNFTKAVKLCLVLNSDNIESTASASGGCNVVSEDSLFTDIKGTEAPPVSFPSKETLLANSSADFSSSAFSDSEPFTSAETRFTDHLSVSNNAGISSYFNSAVIQCRTRENNERNINNNETRRGLSPQQGNEEEILDKAILSINKVNRDVGTAKNQLEQIAAHSHMGSSQSEESVSDELKCGVCKKTFERRRQMLTHGRNPDCVVSCSVCGKKFLSKVMYFVHFCKRHPDISAKSYFREVEKVTHPIDWCVNGEKVKCPLCLKEGKKINLMNHLETIHFQDPSYICCVCGKSFCVEQQWCQHYWSHREDPEVVSINENITVAGKSTDVNMASFPLSNHVPQGYSVVTNDGVKETDSVELNKKRILRSSRNKVPDSESEDFSTSVKLLEIERGFTHRLRRKQRAATLNKTVTRVGAMKTSFSATGSDGDDQSCAEDSDYLGNDQNRYAYNLSGSHSSGGGQGNGKQMRKKKKASGVMVSGRRHEACKQIHTKKKRLFPCDFCEQKFVTIRDRDAHRLNAKYRVTCMLCGSSHSSKGSLFEHYCRVHMDVKDLREQFDHELSLVNLNILTNQGVCPLCMAPLNEEDCVKHFDILHFTNPLYLCCVCGQEFNTENILYDHCCQEHSSLRFVRRKRDKESASNCGKRLEKSVADIAFMVKNEQSGSYEFQCKYCEKTFSCKMSLLSHLKRKISSRPSVISCKLCKVRFKDQASLIAHEKRSHDEGRVSDSVERSGGKSIDCPICKKVVRSMALIFHIKQQHTKETFYSCCVCGAGCQSLDIYKRHCLSKHSKRSVADPDTGKPSSSKLSRQSISVRHPERPKGIFQCSVCGQKFTCGSEFGSHKAIHRKTCSFCGETFPLVRLAQKHYEEMHADQLYPCNHCGKKFPSLKQLHSHERHIRFHPTEPCPKCGLMFRSLKRHMRSVHSDVQEVQCSVCGKTVKNEARLARHMELHKNEQIPCPECSKVFSNVVAWRRHLNLVHFADQSHMCHICGKSFSRKSTLRYHERIHSAIKMFTCPMCSQGFNYKVSLLSHMRSKHPGYELTFNSVPVPDGNFMLHNDSY